jgi:ketosteroid isomerase-like protein
MTASANVELVRSLYEAWARGDFSRQSWMHPEIEWTIVDGPSAGHWRGVEGSEAAVFGGRSATSAIAFPERIHCS